MQISGITAHIKKLALLFVLITAPIAYAYEADIEHIPQDKYFDTALREIQASKESIHLYMYYLSIYPNQPNSQSHRLADAFIEAKERGVEVEVVLDENIDFTNGAPRDEWVVQGKNRTAYKYLKDHGIPVYFDEAKVYTHNKVLVIDKKTTILGSTNWTKTSLTRNHETNVIIRSERFAREALDELSKIKRFDVEFQEVPMTFVSWEFTNRKDLMGEMIASNDERTFDAYLYLLKVFDGNEEGKITIDHERMAEALGIAEMSRDDYRRQINRVLRKLEEKYNLITLKTQYNEDAEVFLKDFEDPAKPYSIPEDHFILIPETYFTYGWNKRLSFTGKAMYLLSVSYSGISGNTPTWSVSRKTLSQRHGLSEWSVSQGTQDLRRWNLLDVTYKEIKEGGPLRQIAIYTPLHLYDPKKLDEEKKSLKNLFGEELFHKAESYASIVYKENDPNAIRTLLELQKEYGPETIEKAISIIKEKRPSNPKRSLSYLIGTINGIGEKADDMAADN